MPCGVRVGSITCKAEETTQGSKVSEVAKIVRTIPAQENSLASHADFIVGKSAMTTVIREDVSPPYYSSSIRKIKPNSSQTFILPFSAAFTLSCQKLAIHS